MFNANQKRRKKLISKLPNFKVGGRGVGDRASGGGGPENAGAIRSSSNRVSAMMGQPPQRGEYDTFGEYMGFAAASTTPITAGIPANDFRRLGDLYGGRQ